MNSNKSANIATAVVAVFAVIIAVFAVYKLTGEAPGESGTEENDIYVPSEEISEEMKDAAEILIENNYTVVWLFYTIGLPHEDEPYGNDPEDGYFSAVSDEYSTAEQIYELVDKTFVADEAERIKTNPRDFGVPLYINKSNGRLGIYMKFEPDYEYPIDWSNPSFTVIPDSDTECTLKITLGYEGDTITDSVKMIKTDGEWRIDRVLH